MKDKLNLDSNNHESTMHMIADALANQFEDSVAVNYIEQTFTDKTDESKSFVLTMQRVNGLTPCEKLQSANDEIEKLKSAIKETIGFIESTSALKEEDGGESLKLLNLALGGE